MHWSPKYHHYCNTPISPIYKYSNSQINPPTKLKIIAPRRCSGCKVLFCLLGINASDGRPAVRFRFKYCLMRFVMYNFTNKKNVSNLSYRVGLNHAKVSQEKETIERYYGSQVRKGERCIPKYLQRFEDGEIILRNPLLRS